MSDIDRVEEQRKRISARNDEIEAKKAALAGRTDDEARQEILRLELRQAEMLLFYETDPNKRKALGAILDRHPKEIARLSEERQQAIAHDPVAVERDRAARHDRNQARVEEALASRAWTHRGRDERGVLREGLPNARLLPNGCLTCANSAAVLNMTDEEEWRVRGPGLSPAEARAAIVERYPAAAKATFRVETVSGAALGGAGGRFRLSDKTLLLPDRAGGRVVMHEMLHATSSPAWHDRVPPTVDEAATEYFTRSLGYQAPGVVLTKAYEGGQRILSDYIAANPAREEALAKAYFAGDFSALEALEDKLPQYIGSRGWPKESPMIDRRMWMWNEDLGNRGERVFDDDEEHTEDK